MMMFFSIPYTIVHYPFNWVLPMALLAFVAFIIFFFRCSQKLISFEISSFRPYRCSHMSLPVVLFTYRLESFVTTLSSI
jgi:hypothetical protein